MIRRKLTRLEVTLDDTKELDDLFSLNKCNSINLINTGSFHQKQSLIGKDNDTFNNITDTSLAKTNISAADANESNLRNTPTTAVTGNTVETPTSDTSQLGYNPQPHNPSGRFQINTDPQQLR